MSDAMNTMRYQWTIESRDEAHKDLAEILWCRKKLDKIRKRVTTGISDDGDDDDGDVSSKNTVKDDNIFLNHLIKDDVIRFRDKNIKRARNQDMTESSGGDDDHDGRIKKMMIKIIETAMKLDGECLMKENELNDQLRHLDESIIEYDINNIVKEYEEGTIENIDLLHGYDDPSSSSSSSSGTVMMPHHCDGGMSLDRDLISMNQQIDQVIIIFIIIIDLLP